ncbi:MAG: tetratricopeptide repeat protein [Ignavibacteriaceae bacterium]|nr:tetratricopeptide repeat protein [Ignavibacteriaceae bacterium]
MLIIAPLKADQQESLPDSLLFKLNTSDIKEKIAAYNSIIRFAMRNIPEKSIPFAEEALKIARYHKYMHGESDILLAMGVSYYSQSSYNESMDYIKQSLRLREALQDSVGIGDCYTYIGLIHNVRGEFDKALEYTFKAIKTLENQQDKKTLARAYNNLGIIYYLVSEINKAESTLLKNLELSSKINDPLILAVSHEHLAIVYIYKKEFEKAINHVEKTIELREKNSDKLGLSGSYDNLAIIYRNMKKYDLALKYFNLSIQLKKELKNKRGLAASISGLGFTYYNLGNYELSKKYLNESLNMRLELHDKRGIEISYNRLADTYYALGDYSNAFKSIKLSKAYGDSLLNEQKSKQIAMLQEEYQAEQKQKEIQLLQKENELNINFRNSLIIILVLLGAVAIVLLIGYRSKKKLSEALRLQNQVITEQQNEQEKLNHRLKELNATKDKLFTIIAHDLKSPFHGIIGILNLLIEDIKELSQEDFESYLKTVKDSATDLYKMLENLLEWGMYQRNLITFNPTKINVKVEFEQIVRANLTSIKNKNLTLEIEADSDVFVSADSHMLNTVLRNIISNAIKFTNQNGSIKLKAYKTQTDTTLKVIDSGIGISSELIPKLFSVGEQTSRPGTNGETSTGLGLVLCKDYVDKHNGKILVESKVGEGTTFTIVFPKV